VLNVCLAVPRCFSCVPPGEYQREIKVASVDGDTLVVSDQAGVLATVTILPMQAPDVGDISLPNLMLAMTAVLGLTLVGLGVKAVARVRSWLCDVRICSAACCRQGGILAISVKRFSR